MRINTIISFLLSAFCFGGITFLFSVPAFGACQVTAPTNQNVSVSGDKATFTWQKGANTDALYLHISTKNDHSSSGMLSVLNVVNALITDVSTFTRENLADGTYYWEFISDGCSGQRIISGGNFQISNTPQLSCQVTAPTNQNVSVSGNKATFTWQKGVNTDALYLHISTKNDHSSSGMLSDLNVVNTLITNVATFTRENLADGTYYWEFISDGCSGQRIISGGNFQISNGSQPTLVPTPTPIPTPQPACKVIAPLGQNVSVSGNKATFTWQKGVNTDALYLHISTKNDHSSSGMLSVLNVVNVLITDVSTFTRENLADGTYYWEFISDGCSGQRVITGGSFQIGSFQLKLSNTVGAHSELPPTVVSGAGTRKVINLTTNFAYNCFVGGNILTDAISLTDRDCSRTVWGSIIDHASQDMPLNQDWKRNYNGTFSLHVISGSGNSRLIAINHGENKNEVYNGQTYQNTVNPQVLAKNCASGIKNGVFSDCDTAYNGFVNLSWSDFTNNTNYGVIQHNDEGPIIWPTNGYTVGGTKSSRGVIHPHGLVDNGYLYVFYRDTSYDANVPDSRKYGVKVARSPISTKALIGTFQSYCNESWVTSLPAGFNKNDMAASYGKQGGCASSVFSDPLGTSITFSVAKKTTGGYLGLVEEVSGSYWQIRLLTSNNLTDWVQLSIIENRPKYGDGKLHYPVFLNSDGSSNEIVDPSNFYIVGTDVVGGVFAKKAAVPSTIINPSDLNNDGAINGLDYLILIKNNNRTGAVGFISADINKDGVINARDLTKFADSYSQNHL